MAGADFGRDGGEAHRQIFDRRVTQRLVEARREPRAGDQPGTCEAYVEISEHPPLGERARPGLEHIEPVGRERPSDHRPDRRAANDVGL